MKKTIYILLASLLSIPCFSQIQENDSLNIDIKKNNLEGTISIDRYPTIKERNIFDDQPSVSKERPIVSGEYDTNAPLKTNMEIYVPKFYQGPSMDNYLSNMNIHTLANDYAYRAKYILSDRSWLNTTSSHYTYPLMGAISYISGTYNYKLTDNLNLSGGSYISKYVTGLTPQNDMGVNAAIRYEITNRIALRAFGQYSAFGKRNNLDSSFSPWFPTTNFGGAFEYKVTERFGIMGGMERRLNPMNGEWKNIPFIAPVFYGK